MDDADTGDGSPYDLVDRRLKDLSQIKAKIKAAVIPVN